MEALAAEVDVRFLTLGFDPSSFTEEVPLMSKDRYRIMRAYMPTKETLGLDIMLRTCTIQASIGHRTVAQHAISHRLFVD